MFEITQENKIDIVDRVAFAWDKICMITKDILQED